MSSRTTPRGAGATPRGAATALMPKPPPLPPAMLGLSMSPRAWKQSESYDLPLGALLTFGPTHVGVVGLWWGLAAGLTVVAAFGVAVLLRTDWDAEARSTAARLGTPEASKGSVPVVETEPPAECPADNVRRAHLVE